MRTDALGCRVDRARRRRAVLALMLAGATTLASCDLDRTAVQSPAPVPKAFSQAGGSAPPAKWWTALADERLNAMIEEALSGNFTLRTAWDRLDQARALAAQSAAPLWPTLDGGLGASRTGMSPPRTAKTWTSDFSLGLTAAYEVDLWGRIRSTHDAARLDVLASEQDLRAAAITLTAQVAGTWAQLIEQRRQLELLDEQLETNRKYLNLITLKFRRGQVSATDVLQQRQLVESTQGQRVLVESRVGVLASQLAVLLGRAPDASGAKTNGDLPALPALPRTGIPAEWMRQRPDVRAAELRVRAADQRVAAALADQMPRLGITITTETSGEQVRDLMDNWLASLAANLVAPLLDGGRRRAEVDRTRAAVSERLNAYGQVILDALKEVEDALTQEAEQGRYVASLARQLELSRQSTEQTRDNYTKGVMDFTRYLTTLLNHQQLQRTHLQARRALVEFRINLYRALGGGWELARPRPTNTPR